MTDKGPGRVIYVGSIPYDQTEEQVLDIFRSVGPVANFRLVFDKDSGKSKGFAFVEYHDAETAASAVRNLNNYQIGLRNLKVDFSHETSIGPNVLTSKLGGRQDILPPLPSGISLPAGLSAPEAITRILTGFSREKSLQIITDLKSVINNNPGLAAELFRASPQLSYAAVQSLLALGLVDPQQIASVVETPDRENTASAEPVQNIQPTLSTQPIQSPQPSQPTQTVQATDPTQAALIRQVMQLSDQQINALPPDQRSALYLLREKVRRGEIQI